VFSSYPAYSTLLFSKNADRLLQQLLREAQLQLRGNRLLHQVNQWSSCPSAYICSQSACLASSSTTRLIPTVLQSCTAQRRRLASTQQNLVNRVRGPSQPPSSHVLIIGSVHWYTGPSSGWATKQGWLVTVQIKAIHSLKYDRSWVHYGLTKRTDEDNQRCSIIISLSTDGRRGCP
jgi:hypothetical protein